MKARPKYRKLTHSQWREIEPLLEIEYPGRGSYRAHPRRIFNTVLYMLWEERTCLEIPRPEYSPPSTLTRTLWIWVENGQLDLAWKAYLKQQTPARIRQWKALFDFYEGSWETREGSRRYGGRVHSKWFQHMGRILKRHRA